MFLTFIIPVLRIRIFFDPTGYDFWNRIDLTKHFQGLIFKNSFSFF